MTLAEMIKGSVADGVTILLTPQGGISLKGEAGAVSRWSAVLKTRKPELIDHLTTEKIVLDWLGRIGEDDPAVIGKVLRRCSQDTEARQYFLMRSQLQCRSERTEW